MKSLKQYFVDKYSVDLDEKGELWELFSYGDGKAVWEGDYDEHRWYVNSTVVMKFTIDGVDRYFEYTNCNPKGEDSSAEDCGWEIPDLDDLVEVFPKQVSTTVYLTADKL